MHFGWVSSTHSLSHASKVRKKSHEEIQLTTKNQTQIKALECFLQENCLEIKKPLLRSKQQRKAKEQVKINLDSFFIFLIQTHKKSSYGSTSSNTSRSQQSTRTHIIFGIQSHTKIRVLIQQNFYQTKYKVSSEQVKQIRSLQYK